MDFKAFTNIQMTMVLVILCQILTITHMLPMKTPSRSDLDLLLDPIHQDEIADELETKIIVPKSVYNTGLRVTTEAPCQVGTQRATEGGPCRRINSSQGSMIDDQYLSQVLLDLQRRKETHHNRNKRPGNRNRHRARTTTTTTELPIFQSTQQEQDGVEDEDMIVEQTSLYPLAYLEAIQQRQTQQDEDLIPSTSTVKNNIKILGLNPEESKHIQDEIKESENDPTTTEVSITEQSIEIEIVPTSTIFPIQSETFSPEGMTTEPEADLNPTSTFATNANEEITEMSDVFSMEEPKKKSSNHIIQDPIAFSLDMVSSKNSSERKEKPVDMKNENVTATDVRVINISRESTSFPPNLITISSNKSSNVKKDPVELLNKGNHAKDESFTTTIVSPISRTSEFSLILDSITDQEREKNETSSKNLETNFNESSNAAGLSSSIILTDPTLNRFNYTDNLKTAKTSTDMDTISGPDVQDFDIILTATVKSVHSQTPSTFIISSKFSRRETNGSEIDDIITDTTQVGSGIEEGRKMIGETSSKETTTIISITNKEILPSTNDESTPMSSSKIEIEGATFDGPEELRLNRKDIRIPAFIPQTQPQIPIKFESEEVVTVPLSQEDIDRSHQKSRTRNRKRNPDFAESKPLPSHSQIYFPDSQAYLRHQSASQKSYQDFSKSIAGYPQFLSIDYLRLGDNYRRFRVF